MVHIEQTRVKPAKAPRTLRSLGPAARVLSALAAGFIVAATGPASADQANVKSISFSTESIESPVVHIVSTDRKKWNQIKPGAVQFKGHMKVDTRWPGYVEGVAVKFGQCSSVTCRLHKTLFLKTNVHTRDFSKEEQFVVHTSLFPISPGGGVPLIAYGDQMVARCNQHLSSDGPTQAHSFPFDMTATFAVDTDKHVGNLDHVVSESDNNSFDIIETDYVAYGKFTVTVKCDPVIAAPTHDISVKQPEFKATSIALFRSTFANVSTRPNPGTVCPKVRWLVRVGTSKAGPVKFKLWIKNGDAPMTSKVVDAWSAFDGSSGYKAEYTEWTEVTKTSVVQGMAEDMTNPIGQSTGWKDIAVQCTGPGGAGFADTPRPNNGGPDVAPLKVTGELSLGDKPGAPKDQPRLGQATFKISANKSGKTAYKLTCTGGRAWDGTLPTAKIADGKYQAVGTHYFQIEKTEQVACALRSTSMPHNDVIAMASRLFEVIKRNPKVDGPDTIADLPKHHPAKPVVDPERPLKPHVMVAPLPKISCANGRVTGGTCFCPAGTMRVHAGLNAYRCIERKVQSKRLTPVAPAAHGLVAPPAHRLRPMLHRSAAFGH